MPKRNAFYMFMEARRAGVLESGVVLTRGRAELSELLSDEWKSLSQEEKDKFAEEAKKFNEQQAGRKKSSSSGQSQGQDSGSDESGGNLQIPPADYLEQVKKANRQYVYDLFETETWKTQPIVVCSFTTYFDPEFDKIFFPSEIGLATFNLKDGVFDNFGRVIDAGEPPLGHGVDVAKAIEVLGLPHPGLESEFAEYEPLMMTLESYLEKYRGDFADNEFYVFALDCDFELVFRCLDWLNTNTGFNVPTRVLSLSLYAHLASTTGQGTTKKGIPSPVITGDQPSAFYAAVSANRQTGKPLNECFVYPSCFPMTKYGFFVSEQEVDEIIKNSDNYKYYDELCCVYHFRRGDGIHYCALNMSNRYAYNILEILTVSNEVEIIPGGHYPQVYERTLEKTRRQNWLAKWGITALEVGMEEPPELEMKITQVRPLRTQRIRRPRYGEDFGEMDDSENLYSQQPQSGQEQSERDRLYSYTDEGNMNSRSRVHRNTHPDSESVGGGQRGRAYSGSGSRHYASHGRGHGVHMIPGPMQICQDPSTEVFRSRLELGDEDDLVN